MGSGTCPTGAASVERPCGRAALVYRKCNKRERDRTMKRSTNRIRTTHVGSLPRPADLLEMMDARDKSGGADPKAYEQRLRSAVSEIVNKQVELGIDVVDDGEYSKPSFVTYINQRLGGFETDKSGSPTNQWAASREALAFPEYYKRSEERRVGNE